MTAPQSQTAPASSANVNISHEAKIQAAAAWLRYQQCRRFIRCLGGEQAARELIAGEVAYLACNWHFYPVHVRFLLGTTAGLSAAHVRSGWTDMDRDHRDTLGSELARLASVALESIDHPPQEWAI